MVSSSSVITGGFAERVHRFQPWRRQPGFLVALVVLDLIWHLQILSSSHKMRCEREGFQMVQVNMGKGLVGLTEKGSAA